MSLDRRSAAGPSPIAPASARVSGRSSANRCPGDAFVEMAVAEIGDVERDHPANDPEAIAELAFQHVVIADAVLEADDHRAVAPMLGDVARGVGGRAALHAHQDDLGSASAAGTQA